MRKNSVFDLLLALVLLTTFAGCSVYMVMLGADAYRSMVDESKVLNNERIAFAFIDNQLKMAESYESISFEIIDDVPCIVIDNEETKLLIYSYDGYLNELLVKKDHALSLKDGERITACKGLDYQNDNGEILISLELNHQVKTKHISLR